ncbi:MAG: transposase [Gemmatimonadetes bacterium]|nr:transposase [Gemmatimonadota bacterium]
MRRHRGRESQRRSHPGQPQPRATRLARYCARHPVALGRLAYRADTGAVTYQSDQASGPTAGAETVDALEFLARVVSDIPNKGQVLQRYYGWYANRTRGIRRRAGVPEPAPAVAAEAVLPALAQARQRWAEDRPDPRPPAPQRAPRPPRAPTPAAADGSPHSHLGVRRSRPASGSLGSGAAGLRAGRRTAPVGPDVGRATGSRPPIGTPIRAEAGR